jgi:transcriptional regulator with XRE-family HTH domain
MEFPEYFAATCCSVLKEYRCANSFSQEELAKRSGLARSYICDVERAARHPSLRNLNILSKALNVSTSDLVHDTELKMASSLDIDLLLKSDTPTPLQMQIINYFSDCSSDGFIVCNSEGKFVLFNSTAERLTGLGIMEVSPDDWSEIYGIYTPNGESLYPSRQLPLARAIGGEKVDRAEVLVKNVKTTRLLKVSARPVVDKAGKLHGGVILFRDACDAPQSLDKKEACRSLS